MSNAFRWKGDRSIQTTQDREIPPVIAKVHGRAADVIAFKEAVELVKKTFPSAVVVAEYREGGRKV